jgi:hypothetical protein
MQQFTFEQTLTRELAELGSDFNLDSLPRQFAVWVGAIVFGLEARDVIDNRILWSDETVCVFRAEEESENRFVLAVCELTLESRDVFDPAVLLERWAQRQLDQPGLTNSGADFSEAERDKQPFAITHLFFTSRLLPPGAAGEDHSVVMSRADLALRYRRMKDPGGVKEPESLELSGWNYGEKIGQEVGELGNPGAVRAHLRLLPLAVIHMWVKQYRNGLFAGNLRYRLSGTGDAAASELDQAIRQTVREHPRRMLIQNNGVTITCQRIQPDADGSVATLIRPQIVNGCQTSWAIFDEIEEFIGRGDEAPEGFVLAKIIETADESLAALITTASNKQNAIQPRDERGRDPRHGEIAEVLANHAPNRRIHWDYRRGSVLNLREKPSGLEYLVPRTRGNIRAIDNIEGGQIVLAMAGALQEAKHEPGELFNPRSRSYEIAFAFDKDPDVRFGSYAPQALLGSGGPEGLHQYVGDVLFGFVVYQHALAAFKGLHSSSVRLIRKHPSLTPDVRESALLAKSERDFVRYWTFDVVRQVHRVAEAWVERHPGRRREVRAGLVGDLTVPKFLDPPFQPLSVRPALFLADERPESPAVLNLLTPSTRLPVLGRWFTTLEELGERVIKEAKADEPGISTRELVLGRARWIHEALSAAVEAAIADYRFVQNFPDPLNGD